MSDETYAPGTVQECEDATPIFTAYISALESAMATAPLIPHPARYTGAAPDTNSSYDEWCDWDWLYFIDYIDDCTYRLEQKQRPVPPRPVPRPVPPRPTPRPLPLPPSPVHPWVA